MPKPPLVASQAGQRLAVAALMAALLAGSLGGAYAFTAAGAHAHRTMDLSHTVGWFQFTLPGSWEAHNAESAARLMEHAQVYRDTSRPSRELIVGTLTTQQPRSPEEVADEVLGHAALAGAEAHSLFKSTRGDLARVEVCLRSVESGMIVQQQVAVVTPASDPTRHAVFYMQDALNDSGTFTQNQILFRQVHQSLTVLP